MIERQLTDREEELYQLFKRRLEKEIVIQGLKEHICSVCSSLKERIDDLDRDIECLNKVVYK